MRKTESRPYYPVVVAQPQFSHVVAAESVMNVPPDVVAVIRDAQSFSIRQHVKVFPKSCCTCPPCVKQENTYSVYAGLDQHSEHEFLRLDEVSDDWNRCCCAPFHPLKIEARAILPEPGTNSEWDNIHRDISQDWHRMPVHEKSIALSNVYQQYPVLFTMVRHDGQRCCAQVPCKWLNTFVCCECCEDGMNVYSGELPNSTKELGRPVKVERGRLLGSVTQPDFGGCCIPTLHLRGESQDKKAKPFAKVEGPCIFGGWSELCCSFRFFLSSFDSSSKSGDLGVIVKQKPKSMAGVFREMMTDADNYTVQLDERAHFTFQQKVTVITSQVLSDYMFFDGTTKMCHVDNNGITCYFWYCSIVGAVVPCCIHIPNSKKGGH